jgi:nitric oxide reductase large subunit
VSKPVAGTVTPEAKRSDALNNYTLANEILQSKGLPQLTGKAQVGGIWGLGNLLTSAYTKLAMNNMKQLNAVVSLTNRQLLKGSGAISDFEARMLSDAASNLGITEKGTTNLTEDMLKKQLVRIRSAFANAAGMEAPIVYTMPDGTTKETTASREEIEALLLAGCAIDYIEELSQ